MERAKTPKIGARILKRIRSAAQGTATASVPAGSAEASKSIAAPRKPTASESPAFVAHREVRTPDAPWMAADAAVVGAAHLRANPPKPCQDAALADSAGRALAILADGAGSAAVSHVGAGAVVAGLRRLCRTLEDNLALALDADRPTPGLTQTIAHQLVAHAKGIVDDLGEAHSRAPADFRCTLLVWVSGRQRALWLKVGDGALVAESGGKCYCVGPAGKGEFANQTRFIDPRLQDDQWAWGEVDAAQLSGLVAMSDGSAERLVASDSARVSPAVGKLLRGTATAQVGRREIFSLLAEASFWQGTSGDDKSLALIARTLPPV